MNDFLSKAERSSLMSRVRNSGTQAERSVRRALWNSGFRYRLNVRGLPGTPDLVLPRYNTVVFVQGCFWHAHCCPKGRRRPTSNADFWNRKLDGNVARDERNQTELKEMGWTVFVVWECSLKVGAASILERLAEQRAAIAVDAPRNPAASQSRR